MKDKKSSCCSIENSDCNSSSTDCCTTGEIPKNSNIKKKLGLGILLIAILFAITSAFNSNNLDHNTSCNASQGSCTSSCAKTSNGGQSCCTKK